MDNTEELTVLSLCTGYGGLDIGLSRAIQNPLRVVAVEVEAYALANLVAKAEEGKLAIEAMWPDLKTFPAEKFRDCFDIITAGYPCQPFSNAGKRKGKDDPRHLWPYIREHIEAIRPVWVFCENVAGHLDMGFSEVYKSLAGMGYKVEAGLFSAAECGLLHERQRLYFLAYSNEIHLQSRCVLGKSGNWETPEQYQGIYSVEREYLKTKQTEPELKLVRMADGATKDMDRFNLLGNGVVPAQAEKAFKTLIKGMNNGQSVITEKESQPQK